MRLFERKINFQQLMSNSLFILKFLILIISLLFLFFSIFFIIFNFSVGHQNELFYFAFCLKITIILILFYLIFQTVKSWINKFQAAKILDEFNKDKTDTYQNALELLNETFDPEILKLIFKKADKKAENQIIKPDWVQIKFLILPFISVLIFSLLIFILNPQEFSKTLNFFLLNKLPPVAHKEFVEVEPGNIIISCNENLLIEVVNPEREVEHFLFYKIEEKWRETKLLDFKKIFNNLDFSFNYFIKTPFASSDTFRVDVFEYPAVKTISIRYDFPKYTGLKAELETESSGHIKAIKNTNIILQIEANNPIQTAHIIFFDGELKEMERLGKSSFKTNFKISKNGSYHFRLKDILGNISQKISKTITVIPDKAPEIRIVSPGKDTLLTQNMLLPLKIFASDDFGLQNLKLFYFINYGEETFFEIRNEIEGSLLNLDYVFDLNQMFLIPGDKVVYWTEITDNSPEKQKAESRKYIARFPSIEEIYQEIEKQEAENTDILQNTLEKSKELEKDFEEKRLEMLKKDEFDWDDKKELEKFLENQENMNRDIQQITEEYQNLIEKFESNKALSTETLEKMQKIKDLMEEISNEQLQEAMEKLQEAMENMDPEVMKKAMEDLKFSMEDFIQKLEQTIDLLEDIKKEQAIQKALEISEEMEEMQSKLNEKTKQQESKTSKQDASELAEEQQTISEKLENLKEQIEKAKEMLDEKKDKEILEKMKELQEQMEQDSLSSDLQESSENLQSEQFEQAKQKQQNASNKMQKMTQKLQEMKQMMSSSSMMEMGKIIEETIRRLLIFSDKHEESAQSYVKDPFAILPSQIANFEGIDLTLKILYSVPMIILAIGPKFVFDANFTFSNYRDLFTDINDAKNNKIKTYLSNIQKGINLMIFDLMQASSNMQQGGGGGMQSLMQSLQQMGQQQMMMNMMTQQLMQQIGKDGMISNETRSQMQKLARDEQRLAENLKRMLQNNPEAQKQVSALNKIVEDLESISRQLKRNRIDQSLLDNQERILSRLLDAQKSIHKREFSKKRKAEISEIEDWELPEEIKLRFEKMRQKALLDEDYKSFPKEYQELIKEYLKLLNEKAE